MNESTTRAELGLQLYRDESMGALDSWANRKHPPAFSSSDPERDRSRVLSGVDGLPGGSGVDSSTSETDWRTVLTSFGLIALFILALFIG